MHPKRPVLWEHGGCARSDCTRLPTPYACSPTTHDTTLLSAHPHALEVCFRTHTHMQSLTHSLPCNHIRRAVPFMHGGVHLRRRVLGDHAPPAVVEEARRVSGRLRALPGWWDHARAAMLRNAIRPCMPRGPTRPRALCENLCLTCRFPRGSLL